MRRWQNASYWEAQWRLWIDKKIWQFCVYIPFKVTIHTHHVISSRVEIKWRIAALLHDIKKWNESGFRPPLCTYRLNWARGTSWGWWDDWDDTVLQTQDSKFEPWRSEAEHATSRSQRLPTILTFTRGWGRNNFVSFKPPRPGTELRTLAWKAAVLTTTLGPPPSPWYGCPCYKNNNFIIFYFSCLYLSIRYMFTLLKVVWFSPGDSADY